jgi:hypothetical protein
MASRRDIKDSDEEQTEALDEEEGEGQESQDEGEEEESRVGRAVAAGGRSRMQRFKAWFRDVRLDVYVLAFTGSLVLFVIGTMSVWARGLLGAGLEAWFASIGGGNVYLFLLGFLCLAASGYFFGALLTKRSEFHRLVKTKAKSDFVRSLDKIERLAFELGTKESEIVAKKKREFRIRH